MRTKRVGETRVATVMPVVRSRYYRNLVDEKWGYQAQSSILRSPWMFGKGVFGRPMTIIMFVFRKTSGFLKVFVLFAFDVDNDDLAP